MAPSNPTSDLVSWFRRLFRRGERGVLLLNMETGDRIVSMVTYRDWLAVVSERGEVYLINADRFVTPADVPDLTVWRQ